MNEYEIYVIPLDGGYEMRICKAVTVHNSASLAEGYAFHNETGCACAPCEVSLSEDDKAQACVQACAVLGWLTPPDAVNRFNSSFIRAIRSHAVKNMGGWKL